MPSIDTCLKNIELNTNYNDLSQQIVTKGQFAYTFKSINDRLDKVYPDNPSIHFQKNGFLDNNYNRLVDTHSKLLNLDKKLTKDLSNHLVDNVEFNKLPKIDTKMYSENTYLSNPPLCGNREIGINRWYNLYKDPTINSIEPVLEASKSSLNNPYGEKDGVAPISRIGLNTVLDTLDYC
jgi:hypothetical protein